MRAAVGLFLTLAAPWLQAQIIHADGPLPGFEVATLKPWQPSAPPPADAATPVKLTKISPTGPPPPQTGRVHFIGQALLLIETAYGLPIGSHARIIGGPAWMRAESDRYELSAKIDDGTWATLKNADGREQRLQIALMEQALLAERLGLRVHFEQRPMTVYALQQAKGGARLTPAQAGETSLLAGMEHQMLGRAVTMDEFAASPLVTGNLNSPVVLNQTGLGGRYDFKLLWDTVPGGVAEPMPFRALVEQQLGLQLVPQKAPVEVIVIDHIERPSAN